MVIVFEVFSITFWYSVSSAGLLSNLACLSRGSHCSRRCRALAGSCLFDCTLPHAITSLSEFERRISSIVPSNSNTLYIYNKNRPYMTVAEQFGPRRALSLRRGCRGSGSVASSVSARVCSAKPIHGMRALLLVTESARAHIYFFITQLKKPH